MSRISTLIKELIPVKLQAPSKEDYLQNDILIVVLTASSYRNCYYRKHLTSLWLLVEISGSQTRVKKEKINKNQDCITREMMQIF